MYTIFRNFYIQYSRWLLSILAPQNQQTNNSKQCCDAALIITTLPDQQQHFTIVQLHKKNKKMWSTHTCTPSFAHFLLNIHVSCCLFSHITNNNSQTNIRVVQIALIIVSYCEETTIISIIINKKRSAKKNAEHTRMYTIFRASSSQYSRRLLSILAQQVRKLPIKRSVVSGRYHSQHHH